MEMRIGARASGAVGRPALRAGLNTRLSSRRTAGVVATVVVCGLSQLIAIAEEHGGRWVGTWGTAVHQPSPGPPGLTNTGVVNQTLRQIVHTSVGGDRVRVRFSTFGAGALVVGAARVALQADGPAIVPESDRVLTFGGEPSITIPPGAIAVSDPVSLTVPPSADLAVSLYLPGSTGPAAWHFVALQTSYVSPEGNFTEAVVMPVAATPQAWFWLTGVDVFASKQTGAIAAFGDSITDGVQSMPGANNRWPDYLARRLLTHPGNQALGMVNQSITGCRLLHEGIGPNALARFDRDVLTQPGVTHAIVLLGNNDLWFGDVVAPPEAVTAGQVIQGHRQLIRRARTRGIKIYGGTLTPLEGFVPPAAFPGIEAKRQAINAWIRTSGEYDGVIDFDEAVRDPSTPSRLFGPFDSGDHLHPNDAGYEEMAKAVDLKLFKMDE